MKRLIHPNMLKRTLLPNGLRVFLFPMENTEALTLLFLAGIGPKYETKELNGISHLLEHLLFKGTKNWPKESAISRELDGVGGFYNAFTDKEMLGVVIKVAPDKFPLAGKILFDMISNPLFRDDAIVREKKVVIQEIKMKEDDPQIKVIHLWEELLYKGQPAGRLISGNIETLAGISRKDIFSHFKRFFAGKNSILIVAGNMSRPSAASGMSRPSAASGMSRSPSASGMKEKKIEEDIRRIFSSLPEGKKQEKEPVKEKQIRPATLFNFKQTDQTHLCLGVRAFSVFSPKRYPLALLAVLLGGMMSSRLFIEVREKRGLAYYLQTFCGHYTDSGYLVTHAGVNSEKAAQAIKIICQEYKKLKEKRIGEKELSRAKENLKGHLRLGLETSDQFAGFFGSQAILGKRILTPEQELKKIAKITSDDILKVAREIFQPHKLNLTLIGPHKEEDNKQFLKVLNC